MGEEGEAFRSSHNTCSFSLAFDLRFQGLYLSRQPTASVSALRPSGSESLSRSPTTPRTMSQQGSGGGPGFTPLPLSSPPVSPTLPASTNVPSSPRRGISQSLSSPLNPSREGSSGSSSEGGGYQRNSASRQSHNGYTHARKDGSQQLDTTTLGEPSSCPSSLSASSAAVFQLRGVAYQLPRSRTEQQRIMSSMLIPAATLQASSLALSEARSVPSRALQLTQQAGKLPSIVVTRWLHRM